MKKLFIALSAILMWIAIPAASANAVSVGQSCAKTALGTRLSTRINRKPVIVVCRIRAGRKQWIRAAIQTLPTTTTSTSTTSTTIPEPVVNYTDVADLVDPTRRIITTDGSKPRTYNIYIPSTYAPDKPVPLLLGFHGLGGSASTFTSSLQLRLFSQDLGFILVVPNGWGNEAGAQNGWNAGNCCGAAYSNNIDDIGLVRSILDSVSRRYSVDKSRIWAMGFSNGGMMSYRLACELSEHFSAIGVGGGALVLNTCSPPNTVSVIHIHGGLDTTVPIDGGGPFFVKPVIEAFKLVNSANACSTMNYVVDLDFTYETTSAVCSDGTEQKLTNYFNQGHEWTIDWTKEILRFLFAHPRK